MEDHKVRLSVIIYFLAVVMTYGQNDPKIQSAFTDSFKAELAENYSQAISDLKAIYSAEDYPVNVRLGWLFLLSKQYPEELSSSSHMQLKHVSG
jgi:uncharacterized membrane protein YukC